MRQFTAIENSTGREIHVSGVKDEEEAYVEIGVQLLGMDPETIDTGNVDVDLREVHTPMATYIDKDKKDKEKENGAA